MQEHVLEGYRLSPQQERLWELGRDGSSYVTQCSLAIEGPLCEQALRAALDRVVARHEILRTEFRSPPGIDVALQIIAEQVSYEWSELDLSSLPVSERVGRLSQAYEAALVRRCELQGPSRLYVEHVRLGAQAHVLILGAPALCLDAWSLQRLCSELMQGYAELRDGAAPRVQHEELLQYADFAQWQNELPESAAGREGMGYWARPEHATRPSLWLAFERPPQGRAPSRLSWTLDAAVGAELDAVAQRKDLKPGSVLLAAWQALLLRVGQEPEELVVDVRFDCRNHDYLQSAVGCFAQYVPIRVSFVHDLTLAALAHESRMQVGEVQRFVDAYPNAARAQQRQSAVGHRIGFSYTELPEAQPAGPLRFQVERFDSRSERLKLELVCTRRGAQCQLELRYDPSVYEAPQMAALQHALSALLEHAATDFERPIAQLAITQPHERRRLVTQWNPERSPEPQPEHVLRWFEDQVAATPHAPAVVCGGQQLDYGTLNRRANQLARYLQRLGVGPDVPVGLVVERSEHVVSALFGIMKAGGAYLPLEPSLPPERRDLLLKEAGVRVLVTEHPLAQPAPAGLTVVCTREAQTALAREDDHDLHVRIARQNLAYIVFTSGSSGTPKGVAVEHGQLLCYVLGALDRLGLRAARSFASVSTLAADLGNTVVYPALCTGATLHLISQECATDAHALAAYFSEHPCDALKIVPSHLAALVAAATPPSSVLPRRLLVLGGEQLAWGTLRVFQAHAPDCRIFNHYGPTETTVGVIAGAVATDESSSLASSVPLGRPLGYARIYLLDQNQQPVPVGVAAEVCVAGDTVARGYVNRPELTAERFVPDPFSERQGARLYRTGDRARYLPDGTIEFLGRIDRQVKLRGYRIELGEVEVALRKHPAVRDSAVVLAGESGYQRLDAYVVAERGHTPSPEALHADLSNKLPEYMLPAHISVLDQLPRTPNGKLDYRALPAPHPRTLAADGGEPARTQTEQILSGIFLDLLGLERVGNDDDFFDIGGHSLLATRLLARARDAFRVDLSLRSVFEAPTVAGLGAIVDASLRDAGDGAEAELGELAEIRADESAELAPLSSMQERARSRGGTQRPIEALLVLDGVLDAGALERALGAVVQRHECLRAELFEHAGATYQRTHPALTPTLSVEYLARDEAPEACVERLGREELEPFAQGGPLLRARLVQLESERHWLLVSMHPLVSDNFSRGILIRELAASYEAQCAGRPSPWPPLPIQYGDFARWQRGEVCRSRLPRLRQYWTKQLAGVPLSAACIHSGHTATQSFVVSGEQFAALNGLCRRQGVTLHMLLLASWQLCLSSLLNEHDLVIDCPMAGRSRSDTQALIGVFSNVLPMRLDASGDPSFRDWLGHVREVVLGACAHHDFAFDALPVHARSSFTLENGLREWPAFGALALREVRRLYTQSALEGHEIGLGVAVTSDAMQVLVEYDCARFTPERIQRLLNDYQRTLESITLGVERRLSTLREESAS